MKSSDLKVISWFFLTGVITILLIIPSFSGISDELLRSSFASVATLIVFALLLIQFFVQGRMFFISSPISIILFFISIVIIFSSLFSMSQSQSLFGFGMEIGTTVSFVILLLFYLASKKFFYSPNLINGFYKILDITFLVLTPVVFLTTFFGTTKFVFDVFDFAVFSGLILLLSVISFEFSKAKIYTFLLVVISYFGILIGNDRSIQISVFVGILIIIFSKFLLIKKTEDKAPYLSGIVLIAIGILFFFTPHSIIESNQPPEVRPSWEATRLIVSKAVIDNPVRAILGTGPNTFSYSWNLYKPIGINNTSIWNINFQNGFSGAATLFATIGLLGGISFLLLLGTVFYVGIFGLIYNFSNGKRFYFILTALTGSVYGLLMFMLQIQSIAHILLTFVFLGILSFITNIGKPQNSILLPKLIKVSLVVFFSILLILSTIFIINKVYHTISFESDVVSFNKTGNSEEAFNNITCSGKYIGHSTCNRFLAELYRNELQTIFLEDTNEFIGEEASRLSSLMLINAQDAVLLNRVDYRNWLVLGNAYTQLAVMGAEDGTSNGINSYDMAIELSPTNPFLLLLKAQLLYYMDKDLFGARSVVQKSLDLKPDYEPSLRFKEDIN